MKHWTCIALTAALLAATPAATAKEASISMRAASSLGSSLGHFIASQGNAALQGIRDEFKKDLRVRIKLYLPPPDEIAPGKPRPQQAPAH
jgi:hypothetical protein